MRNYLRRTFGIDLRSLALFRICVGIILLIDICVRFSDLTVHYVDSGVLPRDVATKETLSIWVSSFHQSPDRTVSHHNRHQHSPIGMGLLRYLAFA